MEMRWEKIRKAMFDAAMTIDNSMTLKEFSNLTDQVKINLYHVYSGDGGNCWDCGKDFDNEFHKD